MRVVGQQRVWCIGRSEIWSACIELARSFSSDSDAMVWGSIFRKGGGGSGGVGGIGGWPPLEM